MKKAISITLNVLSIITAVILSVFIAFFAYDWIRLSNTNVMGTFDFWWVMDTNALCMLFPSLFGLVTVIPNIFIATSNKTKQFAKIMTVVFAVVAVFSVFLYMQPININLPWDSLL